MLPEQQMVFLRQLAKGLAAQFGEHCEVVVHDLSENMVESTVVAIENGHVTGRRVGDGPSHIVLEALHGDSSRLEDQFSYLTRTKDGRMLKSSTIYIRDDSGDAIGVLGINYDLTTLMAAEQVIHALASTEEQSKAPEKITQNVTELLDSLLEESVRLVGKPVPLMNKNEKIRAVQYLNNAGAFLITKSSDKVSKYFGISKFTLYSYIDAKEETNNGNGIEKS